MSNIYEEITMSDVSEMISLIKQFAESDLSLTLLRHNAREFLRRFDDGEPELKPCPFCGGEALLLSHENVDDRPEGDDSEFYFIECDNCNAGAGCFDTKEEAIRVWNRRV